MREARTTQQDIEYCQKLIMREINNRGMPTINGYILSVPIE